LLREGRLEKKELMELIVGATNIMSKSLSLNHASIEKEPNVLRMKEPVIIVGDIHGQFYDLIHMFEKVVDNRNLPK
jgi:serine/threonine-protein phosphatase 2B catalytic subunit